MLKEWFHNDSKKVLTVAGCFVLFVMLTFWWNSPSKSPEKIRTVITQRYNSSKAAYLDIKVHCQDFIDTCGCGEYELHNDFRDRFSQRCNIFWREDKQYGYFNERQQSILQDFMIAQHISTIMIYPDSISFVYRDVAYESQPVQLTITRHPVRQGNSLDTNVYYYW